ncbi:amidase [Salinisphaera aquimarina]|uniref:Amidase n=1 Tax=Salinisphaera aquimarina TaxID=2094031 RepID=A0ABV7ER91_9GAMM
MDFRDTTIEELAGAIRKGERSAEQVMQSTLANIARQNPALNAFIAFVDPDRALEQARAIDARVARGYDPGALAGVPVGVKDLEDVEGLRTTRGSLLFADAVPAADDSIAVRRLRAAGAVVVGKTNTPEFGCKGSTDNLLFGATLNPRNTDYSPGGSSGGSAAALAAGLVPLATGSDGGGSIRIPAAACGFSGFKSSPGVVPQGGRDAPGPGILGVRGPMARTLRDTVIAFDVMKGDDATDIFAMPDNRTPWLPGYDARRLPERVIWAPTLGFAEIDAGVLAVCEAAVAQLRAAGVTVVERDDVLDEHPMSHWWTMWTASMARTLGDKVGTADWERIDPPLRSMVETGLKVTGTDYARALDACHRYNYQLEQAFSDAPFILSPTCAGRTPRSQADGVVNGRSTPAWVEMTFGINMSRNPAASVHAGLNDDGLPVGLQIIGRQRRDLDTLYAAGSIERQLGGPGRC